MSDITDPGKDARREARRQRRILEEQKRKQKLAKVEAEGELALVKSRAANPMKGRRSLIQGTQRETLG